MEEAFKPFTEKVKTRENLISLLDEIDEAKRLAYVGEQTIALSDKLVGKVSEEFRATVADLEKEGLFPTSRREQNAFLTKLEKYLSGLPTIRLIFAFTPSEEFLDRLSTYFEKATGKKTVLDILVKEEIVAGAVIESGGEYRDYSSLKKLEEVLGQYSQKVDRVNKEN